MMELIGLILFLAGVPVTIPFLALASLFGGASTGFIMITVLSSMPIGAFILGLCSYKCYVKKSPVPMAFFLGMVACGYFIAWMMMPSIN